MSSQATKAFPFPTLATTQAQAEGGWQLVSHRKRSPNTTQASPEFTMPNPYIPYTTKQIHSGPANHPPSFTFSSSWNSSRPSSSVTPTNTHYFISPHSPTRLRFPPSSTYPEWKGRCFRCYRTGHTSAKCRNPKRCGKCWMEGHIASACSKQILNPAARPYQPTNGASKLMQGEPLFSELLSPASNPSVHTEFLTDRVRKVHTFVRRDAAYFYELARLNNSVVVYTEGHDPPSST